MSKRMSKGICCMCDKYSEDLVLRNNGDYYCKKCHEQYCEHLVTETVPVSGGVETIVVCHDCGDVL